MSEANSSPTRVRATAAGSPSPARHRREWTHTLDSGKKEQRIHRKKKSIQIQREGGDNNKQQRIEEKDDEEDGDGGDGDGGVPMSDVDGSMMDDSAPLESDERIDQQQKTTHEDGQPNDNTNNDDGDDDDEDDVDEPIDTDALEQEALLVAFNEALSDPTSLQSLLVTHRTHLQADGSSTMPFESFQHLISTLRTLLQSGVQHLLDHVDGDPTRLTMEGGILKTLHQVRTTFARTYPLPETMWLEWIEDVQTIGSGVAVTGDQSDSTGGDDSAEAHEAAQQIEAQKEQHFLLSIYRLSLCDYFSPALWSSFLSYISSVSSRLLSTPSLQHSFRTFVNSTLSFRTFQQQSKKRREEGKRKRKEAKEIKQQQKQKEEEEKKEGDNEDQDEDADMSQEEEKEEEDEDDDGEEDEFTDDEDADSNAPSSADSSAPFNPFTSLHPALVSVLPWPHTGDATSMPTPIPACYSFDRGDALFQKLRAIEMQILTDMMRRLQKKQQHQDGDDDAGDSNDPIDQDDIEDQMERISRLYRIQLKIPSHHLPAVFESYSDWLSKQGEDASSDTQLVQSYEMIRQQSMEFEMTFEKEWLNMSNTGRLSTTIGQLSNEADEFAQAYLHRFIGTTKSRKKTRNDPSPTIHFFERILSIAFLSEAWWMRYIDLLQDLYTHTHAAADCNTDDHQSQSSFLKYQLDVCIRAWRNCPWSSSLIRSLLRCVETCLIAGVVDSEQHHVSLLFEQIISQPVLQTTPETMCHVRLGMIDLFKRTRLIQQAKEGGGASVSHGPSLTRQDALVVRQHFQAILPLLPYVSSSVPTLPAHVASYWAELERRFMYRFGSTLEDETSDMELALSEGVQPAIRRARQVWEEVLASVGPMNGYVWLEYIDFEQRHGLHSGQDESIRQLFERAIRTMTSLTNGFDRQQLSHLRMLEPILYGWIQFDRLHSTSLRDTLESDRLVQPLLEALKQATIREQQQQAWATQQQYQVGVDPASLASAGAGVADVDDGAPAASWLTKPVQQRSAAATTTHAAGKKQQRQAGGKKGQQQTNKTNKKGGEKHDNATAAAPAAAAASSDAQGKKRKRDSEESGDASAQDVKKNKSSSTAAGSSSASASVSAPAAVVAAAVPVPPHTLFVCGLAWTLKESDHRALLEPFGTITRLINHRGSKTVKKPYVEVTYSTPFGSEQAETQLQGKELNGKKLSVSHTPPGWDKKVGQQSIGAVDTHSVFVKNLPRDEPNLVELVRNFFQEKCGPVESVEIPRHITTHKEKEKEKETEEHASDDAASTNSIAPPFKTFGIVRFVSPSSVATALTLHMHTLGTNVISVQPNTTPAREKRAKEAATIAAALATKKTTSFQPRAVATKAHAHPAPTPTPTAKTTNDDTRANDGPIQSNEDFRARLLGSK